MNWKCLFGHKYEPNHKRMSDTMAKFKINGKICEIPVEHWELRHKCVRCGKISIPDWTEPTAKNIKALTDET